MDPSPGGSWAGGGRHLQVLSESAGLGTKELTVPMADRIESKRARSNSQVGLGGSQSKESRGAVSRFQGSRWDLAIQDFSPEKAASRTEFA